MAYTKEILTLAVEIGDCMLRNGAEIYRVEDTVVHILSSYEVEEFDVYVPVSYTHLTLPTICSV